MPHTLRCGDDSSKVEAAARRYKIREHGRQQHVNLEIMKPEQAAASRRVMPDNFKFRRWRLALEKWGNNTTSLGEPKRFHSAVSE